MLACGSGDIGRNGKHPQAATASINFLSSSGVHGVNLGGVMIGRRVGEAKGDGEVERRRGRGRNRLGYEPVIRA